METLRELDIVRATAGAVRLTRADDGQGEREMPTMTVRFSPFGTWYEIDSWWEGRFLERTVRGAFAKTIAENASRVKVMFNHGRDMYIHQKVLGVPESIREDADAAVGDVPLFDTSYVRDLLPGIEAGAYGSSFMFRVLQEQWNEEPGRSDHNPDGLPERTITEVRLYEFGPVTWPANPDATSGIRSGTDAYYEHLRLADPARVERLAARVTELRTAQGAQPPAKGTAPLSAAAPAPPDEPAMRHSGGLTPRERRWRRYPYLKEGASR
ncbi:HK97 family phage prohead protease [Streptosporangium sp. CA-115845]|uniref:HK97 family phage prohead protease n=1 Tax=Streptosporangium sp. CA-115845 TaxID=3240071 RepID=UPI003D91F968